MRSEASPSLRAVATSRAPSPSRSDTASAIGELLARHGLLLYGGATRESARGRGAYRALIRARWDDAVALGTPALIRQGGTMSRPILERLGFERVGEVHMLLDEVGA